MKGKWERKNQIYLFMFFVLCRSNESDFHYIKSYCPYQNIRDKVWFYLVFLFFWLLDTGEGGGGGWEGALLWKWSITWNLLWGCVAESSRLWTCCRHKETNWNPVPETSSGTNRRVGRTKAWLTIIRHYGENRPYSTFKMKSYISLFPERKGYFYTLLQSQGGNKHKNTDLNVKV